MEISKNNNLILIKIKIKSIKTEMKADREITEERQLKSVRLSQMQSFFMDAINNSGKECNPCYLANLYYESIGKRRHVTSRDSFGQTSAAYRACRKLASLNLVKEIHYKTSGGYSYTMYAAFR